MKKISLLLGIACAALFTMNACTNAPQNAHEQHVDPALEETTPDEENAKIDYKVAEHFLVKEDVQTVPDPKIETKAKFDSIFYCTEEDKAAHEIDFSKNYVITVVAPDSNLRTSVQPVSLEHSEPSEVIFSYRWVSGSAQAAVTRPSIVLVVDKKHNGTVVLNEVQ